VDQYSSEGIFYIKLGEIYELQKNMEDALYVYKSLKTNLKQGKVVAQSDFDVDGKIKQLEAQMNKGRNVANQKENQK
jgi:hypothetical protein